MSGEERLLRHVVLLSFVEGTSEEKLHEFEEAFAALPGKIDAIADFEWGPDVSVEGIARGFTHCFLVTFRSAADRDRYLPHPDHLAFSQLIRPHVENVLVLDYWAR